MALRGLHTLGEDYKAGDVVYDDAGNIYYTPVDHTSTALTQPKSLNFYGYPPLLSEALQRSVDEGELAAPAEGQREYLFWEG